MDQCENCIETKTPRNYIEKYRSSKVYWYYTNTHYSSSNIKGEGKKRDVCFIGQAMVNKPIKMGIKDK